MKRPSIDAGEAKDKAASGIEGVFKLIALSMVIGFVIAPFVIEDIAGRAMFSLAAAVIIMMVVIGLFTRR